MSEFCSWFQLSMHNLVDKILALEMSVSVCIILLGALASLSWVYLTSKMCIVNFSIIDLRYAMVEKEK